MFFPDIKRQG